MRVRLTTNAQRDFSELLDFIARYEWGDPVAREAEIKHALRQLVYLPEGWPRWKMRRGKVYRLMIVVGRFFVPYIYYPPIPRCHSGIVSVRAIRHGARRHPLRAVYERPRVEYSAKSLSQAADTYGVLASFRESQICLQHAGGAVQSGSPPAASQPPWAS